MEKKKLLTSILLELEKIEENQQGQLQGGFASIMVINSLNTGDGDTNQRCPTNNCRGGNCVTGCGTANQMLCGPIG